MILFFFTLCMIYNIFYLSFSVGENKIHISFVILEATLCYRSCE